MVRKTVHRREHQNYNELLCAQRGLQPGKKLEVTLCSACRNRQDQSLGKKCYWPPLRVAETPDRPFLASKTVAGMGQWRMPTLRLKRYGYGMLPKNWRHKSVAF